jgi:Protein of unknown function (DUF998)
VTKRSHILEAEAANVALAENGGETMATRSFGQTRTLLACGVVAGPIFVAVSLIQVLTRDGFDLTRHPLSLLSVGDMGWVQIANFIAAGLLSAAFAVGLRRVLHPGPAGTWAPLLMGLYGVGLVVGGAFVADPALGFPPGAPEGIPAEFSWHAAVHNVAPVLAFTAVVAACFVIVRRFVVRRQWTWAVYSGLSGLSALILAAWPGVDGVSVRLAIAVTITFAWETLLAASLLRQQSGTAGAGHDAVKAVDVQAR